MTDAERQKRYRAKKKRKREEERRRKQIALDAEMTAALRRMTPEKIEAGIEWMSALLVPDGPRFGKPFDLQEWQKDWIRGAMPDGIQQAGLSIARKNGKTMLNVLMEACFLAGPWNFTGWVGIACADVGDHAALMMSYLEMISNMNHLGILFRKSPRPGRAYGKNRSELHFLAADKNRTGHASNADVVWLDEAGALEEGQRPLWNALYSAIGSKDGKMICIGNQREGPMFRELEAKADASQMVWWRRFRTPNDVDPMDESLWHLANPGLGASKTVEYLRGKAEDGLISPGNMNYFMSFDLNMDVAPERESIVSVRQWRSVVQEDAGPRAERVVLGVDMGGSVSMSAAFAIGLRSGACRMWTAFSSEPDILSRGRMDGVDNTYQLMLERGEMRLHPGAVVDAAQFVSDVVLDLQGAGCPVAIVGADRYRKAEFGQALREAGVRTEVAWRGQGRGATADGSNDIRAFQRLVFNGMIAAPESLGMVNAILNSHIEYDNALNPRLEKNKSRGRIDLLSAAVIAAGIWDLVKTKGNGQVQLRILRKKP